MILLYKLKNENLRIRYLFKKIIKRKFKNGKNNYESSINL